MSIISLKCPTCDADLTMDDSREFGFCEFCGTKILLQKEKVTINNNYNMGLNEHIVPDYKRGQYNGQTVNGIPNGHGFYMWPDGVSYEGSFVNGVIEGFGKKNYGKSYYEGVFRNNLRCGRGKFVDELGSVYEGTFKNDMKNGEFKSHVHYADRTECDEEATYVDDRQEGPVIFRWADGVIMVCEMHNGTYNGEQFTFDPDGKTSKSQTSAQSSNISIKMGKSFDDMNDMMNQFFNGSQNNMTFKKNGKTVQMFKSTSNITDQPVKPYASKGHAVNGILNGTCKTYYTDGSWDFGEKIRGTWNGQVYHRDASGNMSIRTFDAFGRYTTVQENVVVNTDCSLRFNVIGDAVMSLKDECRIKRSSFGVKFILPTECKDRGSKLIDFVFSDGMNTFTQKPGATVARNYCRGRISVCLTQNVKKGLFGKNESESFNFDIDIDSDAVYRFIVSNGRYDIEKETVANTGTLSCFSDD